MTSSSTAIVSIDPEFTPRWLYYKCRTCTRIFVVVVVDRGDWPRAMVCTNITGGVAGCIGALELGEEGSRTRDWPFRARHAPDAEFYRPKGAYELGRMRKIAPALFAYVEKGGLILRTPSKTYTFPHPVRAEEQHGQH